MFGGVVRHASLKLVGGICLACYTGSDHIVPFTENVVAIQVKISHTTFTFHQ